MHMTLERPFLLNMKMPKTDMGKLYTNCCKTVNDSWRIENALGGLSRKNPILPMLK